MSTQEKKPFDVAYLIKVAIGLFFMFGFGLIPATGVVTQVGMKVAGIFIGVIFLWATVDILWPSVLGILALGLSGYTTVVGAIGSSLGNPTIWMLIMLCVLCEAVRSSGLGEFIARWLVSWKATQGRPLLFTFVFLWGFFLSSILITTFTGILLSWTIIYEIANIVGYKKGDKYPAALIVASFAATAMGGGMLPFQGLILPLTTAFNEATGTTMNYATYIIFSFIIGTIVCAGMALSMKYILHCDFSPLTDFDVSLIRANGVGKLNIEQISYLLGFVFIVLYPFAVLLIPATSGVGTVLNSITQPGWFAVVIIVLSVIRIARKPLVSIRDLAPRGVDWRQIFAPACIIPLTSAFTSDATGIKVWMTDLLMPIFGGMSGLVFIALILIGVLVLTNIGSNTATALIFIAVTVPVLSSFNINPVVLGISIIFSSNMGMILPGSSGVTPLMYGNEWLKPKDIYKYGGLYVGIFAVIIILGTFVSSAIL